jgi:hypothetical protein
MKKTEKQKTSEIRKALDDIFKAFEPLRLEMNKYPNAFKIEYKKGSYRMEINADCLEHHLEKEG